MKTYVQLFLQGDFTHKTKIERVKSRENYTPPENTVQYYFFDIETYELNNGQVVDSERLNISDMIKVIKEK